MNNVLYRKYRAKNFRELIGQDHVKQILTESIRQSNTSHAYLFTGPRGTGKTSVARIMAKAINCLNYEKYNDACDECENCNIVNSGNYVDILEMDAASNRGIEEIRELKENINYVPSFLKYKIYIIDEVHMLTKEAFNALLKTLEEPPSHVVFIMATTEAHKLPITILSRVQRYDFNLGTLVEISAKLKKILENEKIKYESDEVFNIIYEFSGGSYRDAESLLGKLISNNNNEITVEGVKKTLGLTSIELISEFYSNLLIQDIEKSFESLEKITSEVNDLGVFVTQLINFIRKEIIEDIKSKNLNNLGRKRLILDEFIKVKSDFRNFEDKKILIESAILKLSVEGGRVSDSKNTPTPIKPEPNLVKVDELKSSNEPKVELEPISNEIIEQDPLAKKLISEAENFNKRLGAILNTSGISVEKDLITVSTKFKFNAKYLESMDIRNFLDKFVKENVGESAKIVINIAEDNKDLVKISDANVIVASHVENSSNIKPKETIEDFDNSSIVESIL